jgi:hypothetical protein
MANQKDTPGLHVVGKPRPPASRSRGGHAATPRAVVGKNVIDAQKIVQLIASGMTVTEAGKTLGFTREKASKLYNAELQKMIAENDELRAGLVAQELETLRLLKRRFMTDALRGDDKAARIVLGVVDRNMDLLGLKSALQVQISNARIDTTVKSIVDLLEESESALPKLLETDVMVIEQAPGEDATG